MVLREWYIAFSERNDNLKHTIAGGCAGFISCIVTCPLDVVKTRLQNQGVPMPGAKHYRGTASTLTRIWQEEGIRGLYRGLGPTMLGYLPTWSVYFTAYDLCKSQLSSDAERGTFIHILAAMIAGATSTTLTSPLWVIRTRLMTQNERTAYQYRSTIHAFATIFRHEGIRGFYKGLGPSLLGVSHVVIQFPLYERLKQWMTTEEEGPSTFHILTASSLSKMAASIATYPHEVLRTRLQNQTQVPPKYRGIIHGVQVILAEEGGLAFYKGLGTNLVRTVPASALTILTYEIVVRRLSRLEEESKGWSGR
ncbi:uncharacterized protein VTP21DRAFT_3845 [Calcarisporiella thermophila]|uniref:uncharacterized protein n=1 Tax=Calcarisporiella thermophila TaxID=911321 RepID=UPI0037421889